MVLFLGKLKVFDTDSYLTETRQSLPRDGGRRDSSVRNTCPSQRVIEELENTLEEKFERNPKRIVPNVRELE